MTQQQISWWLTFNAIVSAMYLIPNFANSGAEYIKNQALAATELMRGPYPPDEPPAPLVAEETVAPRSVRK
jgi:hypothetical protein